jgi:hypothetical protein
MTAFGFNPGLWPRLINYYGKKIILLPAIAIIGLGVALFSVNNNQWTIISTISTIIFIIPLIYLVYLIRKIGAQTSDTKVEEI